MHREARQLRPQAIRCRQLPVPLSLRHGPDPYVPRRSCEHPRLAFQLPAVPGDGIGTGSTGGTRRNDNDLDL